MKSLKLLLLLILCIGLLSGCSQENPPIYKTAQSIDELKAQLESLLINHHVPGMSVAIVNKDGPLWVAGIGVADVARNQPATDSTLFRIGSVSKGFVSLSLLKLEKEGKLSLNDPVHSLIPEVWFENKWEKTHPIRVVHLLEHTTGWDDMPLNELAKEPADMTLLSALNYAPPSRHSRWAPGTRMAYCNSAAAVAAYIVEKLSGTRFEDYVEQNFFNPILMPSTTYFQPSAETATTLYQHDGKTPHPYWNLLYRPMGALNSNAKDMANYLLFYLNRGRAQNTQILDAPLFDRIERCTTTWAANEGLTIGYGLNNYPSIHDGFVYHGHDGNLPGAVTDMVYLPNEGVGYFLSLNSDNREALKTIGKTIRAYITRDIKRPPLPPTPPLTKKVEVFSGWYEPNSPRLALSFFLERLVGLQYVKFKDNQLYLSSLAEINNTFAPVNDTQFRFIPNNEPPDPLPTLQLFSNSEGQFMQLNMGQKSLFLNATFKHIPSWLAFSEITLAGLTLLSLISILLYTPLWIFEKTRKKYQNGSKSPLLLLPFIAALSLVGILLILILVKDNPLPLLGNFTIWSAALFTMTLVFAIASTASLYHVVRTPKQFRHKLWVYSACVSSIFMISTLYLTYWGIIGLRTWA